MENTNEKIFEEMSESFQLAFGYASNEYYKLSIPLYEKAIEEDKFNFPALNNIAFAKIYIGIKEKNIAFIEEAIKYLKDAISITKEVYKYPDGFPIAGGNLIWAKAELLKLNS